MENILFRDYGLSPSEQLAISEGFARHSQQQAAPPFSRQNLSWLVKDNNHKVIAALTADLLWDWLYIDELWVNEAQRGEDLGTKLMLEANNYALARKLSGIWLWTQSWQAAAFYKKLGYIEFAVFPNFPKGHSRIGFRKFI